MSNEVRISVVAADKASATLKGIEKNVSKLTGALKLAAVAGAAAMGAMAVASVKSAGDFEETMTRAVGLAGLLPQEVDKVTAALLKMAPAMGKSPQELAEAFYFASSAGLDTEKALSAVAAAAKASAAGLGETQVVTQSLTAVMNAYGLAADQTMRITDTLVATVKLGTGEASDLAATIGKVIPVASQMGVSFEEVGASLAIMTRIGLNADEATTALRGVLNALIAPSAEAATTLKAMGTSADEVRKAIKERGLAAVLVEMMEALDGNDEALSKIFPDIRAFTGVLATAGKQSQGYAAALLEIQKATGMTENAFSLASDTFNFKMGQLKGAFDTLKIQIGNALLPTLKDLADWFVVRLPDIQRFIEDGIKNLQKALQDNKQTLIDAAKGIAAVGAAFMTFGGWVIANKVALVAALTAIGVALIWATGPVGIAAGILSIAAALGILSGAASDAGFSVSGLRNNLAALEALPSWVNAGGAIAAAKKAEVKTRTASSIREAARWAQEDLATRIIPRKVTAVSEPPPVPSSGLFDTYTGAADDAAKAVDILDDGIIDLAEAMKNGIDLVSAARMEGAYAEKEFANSVWRSGVEIVKLNTMIGVRGLTGATNVLTHALTTLGEGFRQAGETITQFLGRLATSALSQFQGALDALLGRPTRETTTQQLKVADLERRRLLLLQQGITPPTAEELKRPGFELSAGQKQLKTIEAQIKSAQDVLTLREKENEILRLKATLEDKTISTNQEMLAQYQLLVGAISDSSTLLKDQLLPAMALEAWARADAAVQLGILATNAGAAATAIAGAPGFAEGGVGDFGKGTLAMLHGKEAVIPLSHMNPQGGNSYEANVQVNVTIDPELADLREQVLKEVRDRTDALLRRAGFGGSFVTSGAYAPS